MSEQERRLTGRIAVRLQQKVVDQFEEMRSVGVDPNKVVRDLLESAIPVFQRLVEAKRQLDAGRPVLFREWLKGALEDMTEAVQEERDG